MSTSPDEGRDASVPADGSSSSGGVAETASEAPVAATERASRPSSESAAARAQLRSDRFVEVQNSLDEVGQFAESDMSPAEFYGEVLRRTLQALLAKGGVIWRRTPQGNLQSQCQIAMPPAISQNEEARERHNELLRYAIGLGRSLHLSPRSSGPAPTSGGPELSNPTYFNFLIVPILIDRQVHGLIEVWLASDHHAASIPSFMQFIARMAEVAARYQKNQTARELLRQQTVWLQVETFSRQIHSSLNPTEVAYTIANEARRLLECDRVSVAVRLGRRVRIQAISGAEQVEKRAELVKLMRALADAVIRWGEKLVYTGTKDDSLPPPVHAALDAYLEESHSRILVLAPLRDERDQDSTLPPRSALIVECFASELSAEPLMARLDVVGKHCAPALYNAVEHRRIPFRFVWMPMAKVQEGLGGKARAITLLVALAVVLALAALFFIPYPLKVEATGELQPEIWSYVYAPTDGCRIEEFYVSDPRTVEKEAAKRRYGESYQAVRIYAPKLGQEIAGLEGELAGMDAIIKAAKRDLDEAPTPLEKAAKQTEYLTLMKKWYAQSARLKALTRDYHAEASRPNMFVVELPRFPAGMSGNGYEWTVLSSGFDGLRGREVKASEPLLRVGYVSRSEDGENRAEPRWQIELKIPQKHIGQVLKAFKDEDDVLDVDLLVKSAPTKVYKGKLPRPKVAGEARPHQTDANESEPVVFAWVQIKGEGIKPADQIPDVLLKTGTEVHAKVYCGSHKLGYSLFYGIWEFFYEKVVFFF